MQVDLQEMAGRQVVAETAPTAGRWRAGRRGISQRNQNLIPERRSHQQVGMEGV